MKKPHCENCREWFQWSALWFVVAIFLTVVIFWMRATTAKAATDPVKEYRQNLANETFNWLAGHALCVEGEDAPCDWVYDGAYQLHQAAKDLYSDKLLKDIHEPVSDWDRGGYTEYLNPLDYLEHEYIKWRIHMLVVFGVNGIPARGT